MAEAITDATNEKNEADYSQGDQPVLQLAFTCTPAERSEASTYMTRQQLGRGSKWLTWLVLLVIAVGLVLDFLQKARTMSGSERWIWGSVVFIIWPIAFTIIRKRSRSTDAVQMDIFDWGFRIAADKEEAIYRWTSLSRAVETPSSIVLQVAKGSFFYTVPKRVLPSIDWANWLVDIVSTNRVGSSDESSDVSTRLPALSASHEDDCIMSVEFGPTFWNAMNFVLASWFTRALVLAWIGMQLGATIYVASHPSPDAVVPMWKVFLFDIVPAMIVGSVFLILMLSARTWLRNRRQPVQTIQLYDSKIVVRSAADIQTIPWSGFTHFKETPWSFLRWKRFTSRVLVLPKSGKLPVAERSVLRKLLLRKVKESSWFWSL